MTCSILIFSAKRQNKSDTIQFIGKNLIRNDVKIKHAIKICHNIQDVPFNKVRLGTYGTPCIIENIL